MAFGDKMLALLFLMLLGGRVALSSENPSDDKPMMLRRRDVDESVLMLNSTELPINNSTKVPLNESILEILQDNQEIAQEVALFTREDEKSYKQCNKGGFKWWGDSCDYLLTGIGRKLWAMETLFFELTASEKYNEQKYNCNLAMTSSTVTKQMYGGYNARSLLWKRGRTLRVYHGFRCYGCNEEDVTGKEDGGSGSDSGGSVRRNIQVMDRDLVAVSFGNYVDDLAWSLYKSPVKIFTLLEELKVTCGKTVVARSKISDLVKAIRAYTPP